MLEEFCQRQHRLAVILSKDHGLTRQHIAPVPAGIDPGHQESGILPHRLPQGCYVGSCEQPNNQSRYRHNRCTIALTAAESKDILTLCPAALRWDIAPRGEQPRVHTAAVEGQRRNVELNTPVFLMGEQLLDQGTPVLRSRCETLRNARSTSYRRL